MAMHVSRPATAVKARDADSIGIGLINEISREIVSLCSRRQPGAYFAPSALKGGGIGNRAARLPLAFSWGGPHPAAGKIRSRRHRLNHAACVDIGIFNASLRRATTRKPSGIEEPCASPSILPDEQGRVYGRGSRSYTSARDSSSSNRHDLLSPVLTPRSCFG